VRDELQSELSRLSSLARSCSSRWRR
jgi:hypothetical protein